MAVTYRGVGQYAGTATDKAPLSHHFPDWELGQRDLLWLWWHTRHEVELGPDDYLAPNMGEIISNRISGQHIQQLKNKKPAEMLPAAKLPKIENDPRAVRWMINEFAKRRHPALQELPQILSGWETLVALIDLELGACEYKLSMLQRMEADWASLRHGDQHFRWFHGPSEKARCKTAWEWYAARAINSVDTTGQLPAAPFQNYDELASFWDTADLRLGERRHHLEQIKKFWKNLETKKNQVGKKQTNVLLSAEAAAALAQLTATWGMTKKEVFDKLLLDAVDRAPGIGSPPGKRVG